MSNWYDNNFNYLSDNMGGRLKEKENVAKEKMWVEKLSNHG